MQVNDSSSPIDITLLNVQKLSIQLLDIEKTEDYTGLSDKRTYSLEEMIDLIVQIYNDKQHKTNGIDVDEELSQFSSTPSTAEDFGCSIFTRTTQYKTRLARSTKHAYGSHGALKKIPKQINTIFLLFYHRIEPRKEIFAATNDYGWKIVRPCVNYQFTRRVAMRILDPNQIIKIARRCLLGSNVQEILTNPSGHELRKTSTLYYLIESFVASVKASSSLHLLFDQLNQPPPKYISISTGLLRIEKEIPLICYPEILKLFSRYDRGEETYAKPEGSLIEETSDPQFEFLNFLQEVHELIPILNEEFVSKIVSDIKEQNYQVHLCHKHLHDFLNATDFEIQLKPKHHFYPLSDDPPSLETIVIYLRQHLPTTRSSSREQSEESFYHSLEELLLKGALSFSTASGEIIEKLVNCLEGEIRYNNQSYFKVRGMWYLLQADYHMLLQQDFKQTLQSLLLDSQHESKALLPLEWRDVAPPAYHRKQKRKPEETYNRSYLHTEINEGEFFGPEQGYIVLDQILPFNIEPCDIVRYTPTTTYLIHVKADFGQKTRDACSQILNAAKQFRNASPSQTGGFLPKLWEAATREQPAQKRAGDFRASLKAQLEHLGKSAFFQILSTRKLVFVYAYAPTEKVNLTKESALPTYLTANHLESIDEVSNDAEELFETLQSSGYLDRQGRLTIKFYSTTQEKFKEEFSLSYEAIELSQQAKSNIYTHLKKLATTSGSTLAKLEILQLAKEVRDLGFELKICEIQRNHSKKHFRDESNSPSGTKFSRHQTTDDDEIRPIGERLLRSRSSSSSSQLPPESLLIQNNPFKNRFDPSYLYQAADISTIQSKLLKKYSDSIHFLTPLNAALDIETMMLDIHSKVQEKPVLGTYNKDRTHWVIFYLVKNESTITCLYKDSKGDLMPQRFRNFLTNTFQELQIIQNTQAEQLDGTSCGIFALQNMKILMEKIQYRSFIKDFKSFFGFCRQDQADDLRKQKFPSLYVEGINHSLKEEQQRTLCRRSIRTHHQEEVDRLGEILRAEPDKTIKILGFDEDLDRVNESNTIAVELVVEQLNLRQQNYNYCYCFRSTHDISLESLQSDLQRLLNISSEHLTIEETERVIKIDPAFVVAISKKEKMTEFPEPNSHIDETELFQTLYLETAEQQENVREILQQISQKTQ
jgi:uncharacterized protein (TIGR04141 family)